MDAQDKTTLVHAAMGIVGHIVILVGATMIHSGLGLAYAGWTILELAKDLTATARHQALAAQQREGVQLLQSILNRDEGKKDEETRH